MIIWKGMNEWNENGEWYDCVRMEFRLCVTVFKIIFL